MLWIFLVWGSQGLTRVFTVSVMVSPASNIYYIAYCPHGLTWKYCNSKCSFYWLKTSYVLMFPDVCVGCSDCFSLDRADVHAPGVGQCSAQGPGVFSWENKSVLFLSLSQHIEADQHSSLVTILKITCRKTYIWLVWHNKRKTNARALK